MPRYEDPYAPRPREAAPNRDPRRPIEALPHPREGQREREQYHRMDDPMMDVTRNDQRMDPRIDPRQEPRANTGRPVQVDPHSRGQGVMWVDVETGAAFPGAPPAPARRTPYDDDYETVQSSMRPIIDPKLAPGQPRPAYNEYFVPGDGIDREVIQREICRYLGHDATCRPGKHDDGRTGYLVRAYRALTSEMIRSLQESSTKFWAEKQRRMKSGHPTNITFSDIQDNRDLRYYYSNSMEMDDDPVPGMRMPQMETSVHRPQIINRPVPHSNDYISDTSYQGQSMSTAHPGPRGPSAYEPRGFAPGNTPPPNTRSAQSGYSTQPAYIDRTTGVSAPGMTAAIYRDQPSTRTTSYPYPQDKQYRR